MLLGFKGYGKTQLMLQVTYAASMLDWALRDTPAANKWRHVAVYANKTGLDENLKHAPPQAFLAAALYQRGMLLKSDVPPDWVDPEELLSPDSMRRWLDQEHISFTLVVDEFQEYDPTSINADKNDVERARPDYRPMYRALNFLANYSNSMYPGCIFLTGTTQDLPAKVYSSNHVYGAYLQHSKFPQIAMLGM